MPTQDAPLDRQKVASLLLMFLGQQSTCEKAWSRIILADEFDHEPELRNRVCTIWLCAALDVVEGEARLLDVLETQDVVRDSAVFHRAFARPL